MFCSFRVFPDLIFQRRKGGAKKWFYQIKVKKSYKN